MEAGVRKAKFRTRLFMVLASCTGVLLLYVALVDTSAQQGTRNTDKSGSVSSISSELEDSPPPKAGPSSDKKCLSQTNIMFLKTHKCASSTVQNILMRFGDTRNLTFVLPVHGNYLGHPTKFNATLAVSLPSTYSSEEYNIFCHHTRWDLEEVEKIMPKNTIYISILKEPAAMFESLYNWVNLDQRYGVSLETFLQSPMKYYKNSSDTVFARNPMSFDFGLEPEHFEDPSRILSKIAEVDDRFSLIMLSEYMDESLVLLRQLFCWTWEDVVVFKVNARKSEFKTQLSAETREKIRQWNFADTQMYSFFRKKFERRVEKYGKDRMRADVALLRQVTRAWYGFCVQNRISKNETADIRFQVWHQSVEGFQLTSAGARNRMCVQLATAENPFTDYLRIKLWPKYNKAPEEPNESSVDKSWLLPGYW